MNITYGYIQEAQKVVIYGPEGIGKSTFAAQFPEPLFIDTEGSTKRLNVARLPAPATWEEIGEEINYVLNNPTVCKTLVIDTADWAERLCEASVCAKAKKNSIEDFGYGKGYTYLSNEFAKLLKQLNAVIRAGINVVVVAHAKLRKFEQPDELGAYDRWELKLSKFVAPMLKEWADAVLFANYKTYTVKTDNDKYKAAGGERVMYATHHPCWDAKNRYGLDAETKFSYEIIRQHIESDSVKSSAPEPEKPKTQITSGPTPQVSFTQLEAAAKEQKSKDLAPAESFLPPEKREPEIPHGIPQALADLMRENHVDASEIQMVVFDKGYYPFDTPISSYDPDFISSVLVGAWPQVFACIQENREDCPF